MLVGAKCTVDVEGEEKSRRETGLRDEKSENAQMISRVERGKSMNRNGRRKEAMQGRS